MRILGGDSSGMAKGGNSVHNVAFPTFKRVRQVKIGFMGTGQMAQALAAGIALARPDAEFLIHDPVPEARRAFRERVGGSTVHECSTNDGVGSEAEIVFLVVKPQYCLDACREFTQTQQSQPLLISIVAGVRLNDLRSQTGLDRIIRVMPNTPCLVQQGAMGIVAGSETLPADRDLVRTLLAPLGVVHEVTESQLDAVTGMAGSGPAYVFQMIEALSDGGVLMGLPRAIALDLAVQTVLGAATLVRETGEHPAVLKDRVASPAGTTMEGLEALERGGFRAATIAAVRAAAERSRQLGQD